MLISGSIAVFRAHPYQPQGIESILECLRTCSECSIACIGCADACMAEDAVADLRECIRVNLDCADLAATTGAVIARLTKPQKAPVKALLNATIESCHSCAQVCENHAAMHEHCKACAECCHSCAHACTALLETMS